MAGNERYLGIDLGAETIKIVVLSREGGELAITGRHLVEHFKEPANAVRTLLAELGWDTVRSAAATGRVSRMLELERVPTKAALAQGVAHAFPEHNPGTVVSIGSHGFSVLELRGDDNQAYRENSRCSQGTGNFLRQLVERFDLTVAEASEMCTDVDQPAALSGRCPVILKTDMTHLANKGEPREAILAGLYDAVCENVQVLIKPALSPARVLLVGGVTRARRVRDNFRRFLSTRGMQLVESDIEETLFLEALGAAVVAATHQRAVPSLDRLIGDTHEGTFEKVPALKDALRHVKRMPPVDLPTDGRTRTAVLGFDMGSTGSKALAIDAENERPFWEGYVNTLGDPVNAARKLAAMFLEETGGHHRVVAVGATGSGREIVGSLMASCFGPGPVFVLNEIAAHATGALYFDPEVDTIFEIGGQDAKYIRLDGGRICDAAMNEACSAGTGSFIAEQGGKFQDVEDVVQMGEMAMDADFGISLGQHCSVFMAEVIDGAVSAGTPQEPILAGIYDSIIQNYLNRVKGNRSVGRRIFCQGMPFMSDALAAAVGRQTGRTVIVPPNPGTIGALGIALLTRREVVGVLDSHEAEPIALDLSRFLTARVKRKDTLVCKSTKGCGGAGNKCRIDRMFTEVSGETQRFLWGGHCSLYDAGTHKQKLPDRTPDPFRQRRELFAALIDGLAPPDGEATGAPVVALTEEFMLKGLLPFFATFVRSLGFDVRVYAGAGHRALKRGIETANIPFCAPMQLFQGVMAEIFDDEPDFVLVPRLRELPRQKGETHAVTCPIVQAAADIVGKVAGEERWTRLISTRVDMGEENLISERFRTTTRTMARDLGAEAAFEAAFEAAVTAQKEMDRALAAIGREALAFARERGVVPVVVLGRTYTIYNNVLNSNVPNLLREQGALAIPVDCYPVDPDTPVFNDLYWGYGQVNLRAAHDIRRTDDVYAIYCSNYSCGPDSFNLHFFSYVMENKPYAIIETDGHAGDAGTKTRIEAFLYCVEGDRRLAVAERARLERKNFKAVEVDKISIADARRREELMLIPPMGPVAQIITQALQAEGVRCESLPVPTRDTLRIGRRYTSGKECVPMTITLGSLLERVERERGTDERFAFFMPTACGPCRFGVYNLLHKIVLEKTGWKDRVRIVSPSDQDYFAEMSTDFRLRTLVGFSAADMLQAALHDVRPVERKKGAAQAIHDRYFDELKAAVRAARPRKLVSALGELPAGMFGVRDLLRRAAADFRDIKDFSKSLPTVGVVGEIYARLDPFANDYIIERLESRGVRAVLAPMTEWLEYTTFWEMQRIREGRAIEGDVMAASKFTYALELGVINRAYDEMAGPLRWGPRTTVEDTIKAGSRYISPELWGEAVLTLGGPLHEHLHGLIDGVLSVGPHECMPTKVAEAQYAHVAEDTGLLSLTLSLNGDPVDPEVIDRFVFEVKERHARRGAEQAGQRGGAGRSFDVGTFARALQNRALFKALRVLTPFAAGAQRFGGGGARPEG